MKVVINDADNPQRRFILPVSCLVAICAAETLTVTVGPVAGISSHILVLFCLILLSSFTHDFLNRRLYLSLTLAPLTRIVSLSMPLNQFTDIVQYLVASIPLLIGAFVIIRTLDLSRTEIGFTLTRLPILCILTLVGIALGTAEYYILRPEGIELGLSWEGTIISSLVCLLFGSFVEELVFRGIIQYNSISLMKTFGWVYAAILYALLHIAGREPVYIPIALLLGLLNGWLVIRTRSLVGVTLLDTAMRLMLYIVMPFLI